jgi:hypothetical protein
MVIMTGKKRLAVLIAALALAGTVLFATGGPAIAAEGPHKLKNGEYGQCLGIPTNALNTPLRLMPCSSSSGVTWTFIPLAPGSRAGFLVNRLGWCAEVNNDTSIPGELVDAYFCNGTYAELWIREGFMFRHGGTDQCLDTVSGRNSGIMQYTCQGNAAQLWLEA